MKTYTFEVSLPDAGDVWRKIEMRADQSLHDLHLAIQAAYDWDADHLYSFFMSGMAWDPKSEYTLSDEMMEGIMSRMELELDDEDRAELDEAVEWMEESEDKQFGEDLPMPTAEEQKEMFEALTGMSDEEKQELIDMMAKEAGVPKLISEMMFGMLDAAEDVEELSVFFDNDIDPDALFDGEETEAGDSMKTAIDSLELKPDDVFMYLFDYGDEWRFAVRVDAIAENAPDDAEYPLLVDFSGPAPEQYPVWDDEDWDDDEILGDDEDDDEDD